MTIKNLRPRQAAKHAYLFCEQKGSYFSNKERKWINPNDLMNKIVDGETDLRIYSYKSNRDITRWKLIDLFLTSNSALLYSRMRHMNDIELALFIKQHKSAWEMRKPIQEKPIKLNNLKNLKAYASRKEFSFKPKVTLSNYLEGFAR